MITDLIEALGWENLFHQSEFPEFVLTDYQWLRGNRFIAMDYDSHQKTRCEMIWFDLSYFHQNNFKTVTPINMLADGMSIET